MLLGYAITATENLEVMIPGKVIKPRNLYRDYHIRAKQWYMYVVYSMNLLKNHHPVIYHFLVPQQRNNQRAFLSPMELNHYGQQRQFELRLLG